MMKCSEVAQLISETRDRRIPLRKTIGMRLHIAMCRLCRLYFLQIEWLGKLSLRAGELVMTHDSRKKLPPGARQRMKSRLSADR